MPQRFRLVYPLLMLTVVTSFIGGCATIHNRRYQSIPVTTTPAGASVVVQCGKSQSPTALTPTMINVSRRALPCAITLTRAGYASRTISLQRKVSGWFWANLAVSPALGVIGYAGGEDSCAGFFCSTRSGDARGYAFLGLFPGGIGMGVDAITGAMYKRLPARIDAELTP